MITTEKKPSVAEPTERIVNDESRLFEMFDMPCVAHQGDLIFVALPSLPKSIKPRSNRQLADGSTQGSRHVAERGDVFDADPQEVADTINRLYKPKKPLEAQYVGPVILTPDDPTADDYTHPEHGNYGFPAKTVCAVVYQRNLDAEQRAARVQD